MNKIKTMIITGASSGIGRETVKYFSSKGWQIAATMRNPTAETELANYPNISLHQLDVNSQESVDKAINEIWTKYKKIDVIVNNAGYGLIGTFEGATEQQIYDQFNTNLFGLMRVTRAALPHLRLQGFGRIINVSSVAGFLALPLYSIYNASKFAVEGFSESLNYELKQFNIKVKLIQPGPIKTDFNHRSKIDINIDSLPEYQEYDEMINRFYNSNFEHAPAPIVVAKQIYKASTSNSKKMRFQAGFQAKLYHILAKSIPNGIIRFTTNKITHIK